MSSTSKSLISKLTVDDAKDPSGYQLKELSTLTYQSPSEAKTIYDMLMKRLQSSKPDVKYKTLRTIKYLVLNGSRDFSALLQRNNSDIRSLNGYRCEPDPLRGDTISIRVSNEAKETIHAIFNIPEQQSQHHTPAHTMEGYGYNGATSGSADKYSNIDNDEGRDRNGFRSSSSSGSLGYRDEYDVKPAGSSSKYEGYGSGGGDVYGASSSSKRYSDSSGIVGKLSTTAMTLASAVSDQVKASPLASDIVHRVSKQVNRYAPASIRNKFQDTTSSTNQRYNSSFRDMNDDENTYNAPSAIYSRNSNYTDHYDNASTSLKSSRSSSNTTVWGQPANAYPSSSSSSTTAQNASNGVTVTLASAADGMESKLVNQITAASGIKSTPSATELQQFFDAIESLDTDHAAELLYNKLQSLNGFATKMKSLSVIQYMLDTQKDSKMAIALFNYLNEHSEYLEQLEQRSNQQLKQRAFSVMQALGLRDENDRPPASSSSATTSATHSRNTSQQATRATANQSEEALDLLNFSESGNNGDNNHPSSTSTNDLSSFEDLQQNNIVSSPTPTAVSTATSATSNFDFMSEADSAANSSKIVAAPLSNREPIDSMFGELSFKQDNNSATAHPQSHSHTQTTMPMPSQHNAAVDLLPNHLSTRTHKQGAADLLHFTDSTPSLLDGDGSKSTSGKDRLAALLANTKSSTAHLQHHTHHHPQQVQPHTPHLPQAQFSSQQQQSQYSHQHQAAVDPFFSVPSRQHSQQQPPPSAPVDVFSGFTVSPTPSQYQQPNLLPPFNSSSQRTPSQLQQQRQQSVHSNSNFNFMNGAKKTESGSDSFAFVGDLMK